MKFAPEAAPPSRRTLHQLSSLVVFMAMLDLAVAQTTTTPLTMVVGSSGHMRSDGKGPYVTGVDDVAVWLEPSRWPRMSFDSCMDWPFAIAQRPTRTVEHHLTDPVPTAGGKPIGIFSNYAGNDLVISRPVNATVTSFMDIAVGSSVSPDSAEVRFCNADCTEYYVVIFGKRASGAQRRSSPLRARRSNCDANLGKFAVYRVSP